MQAVDERHAIAHTRTQEGFFHLASDINDLAAGLSRHAHAFPTHEKTRQLNPCIAHASSPSLSPWRADPRTDFNRLVSTGFGRYAKAPWATARRLVSRVPCAVSTM